jgi:predicted protein tyrosine phosphatase
MLTEILSGLWIGNINDSYNEDFYRDNQIDVAINCTYNQGFLDLPNLKKIRISLSDRLDPRDIQLLKENIQQIINFIDDKIEENNILIYCYNGLTVSPLIVALYMIKKGNIELSQILDILHSKNKSICLDFDLTMF